MTQLDQAIDWLYDHRTVNWETGCWECGNRKQRHPLLTSKGLSRRHGTKSIIRLSAQVFRGLDQADKRFIYHRCGNNRCFNYEHLLIGHRLPPEIEIRVCSDCRTTFPATGEHFYKMMNGNWFLQCKTCTKAKIKASAEKRKIADPEGYCAVKRAQHRNRQDSIRAGRKGYVHYSQIMVRDDMTCHICRQKIQSLQDLHFDHVVPLSKGGVHADWNVACAHATCNMRKYNKVLDLPPKQLSFI